MPFDWGLRTGVVHGSMPMSRSKDAVSPAMKQEPLSVSHSMGVGFHAELSRLGA